MPEVVFEDWGLIDYSKALERQLQYVEVLNQSRKSHPGFLIFCTHPAVVTTGRQTQAEDIFSWNGPTVEVSRGGRATYHGPSQLVVYPIIDLQKSRHERMPQEVRGFLRAIEESIVQTLRLYNLTATGRSSQQKSSGEQSAEETGVWVGQKKIASVGIAVKNWISFHGAAINLDFDVTAFQGLKPCGFQPSTMTSLEEILQKKIDRQEFQENLREQIYQVLI